MKFDQVPIRWDKDRGCGRRKPGGLYLVGGQPHPCPKLPIPIERCPVCNHGLKHCRGWMWIEPDHFTEPGPHGEPRHYLCCPLGRPGGLGDRAGLLWIGAQYYQTPEAFMKEWATQGISRRIARVPQGFVMGKTWILLAHIHACEDQSAEEGDEKRNRAPGIIAVFQPGCIEYVCRGDETEDELEAMRSKGIVPVRVLPYAERSILFGDPPEGQQEPPVATSNGKHRPKRRVKDNTSGDE